MIHTINTFILSLIYCLNFAPKIKSYKFDDSDSVFIYLLSNVEESKEQKESEGQDNFGSNAEGEKREK